jgi:hypothetical protein
VRRWAKDRIRLALRKAMPRLMLFAFMPTQHEIARIVEAFAQQYQAMGGIKPTKPADRQTLH